MIKKMLLIKPNSIFLSFKVELGLITIHFSITLSFLWSGFHFFKNLTSSKGLFMYRYSLTVIIEFILVIILQNTFRTKKKFLIKFF
jgi:hypothetical protein